MEKGSGPGFGAFVVAVVLAPLYFLSRGKIVSALFSITFCVWAFFASFAGMAWLWLLPLGHIGWHLNKSYSSRRDSSLAEKIARALKKVLGSNSGRRRRNRRRRRRR
ncbi:MAG: hypothetical protein UX75_C0027G0008 [Candidatus Moranbacteria bacterium GW2011_GWE2_47_10]|nr:MAG: hypothetical protein UX75_C0027G0008 [Candidatus Moranbacteria bacterium GW2011_GWE2_47_10]HBP00800.1 hypothetical protein [Candidatus Moranbacteria bacterium]